jgi:Fe-S cluster assembly scaffold protein SufB
MAQTAPKFETWLSSGQVDRLSAALADPPSVVRSRREAYERFLDLPIEPNPLYRGYGYFTNVDLSGIDLDRHGSPVDLPTVRPDTLRIVHDTAGTHVALPSNLSDAGVRVIPLAEVWSSGEEGVARFLRGAETATDRLSALATAALNRGYRLEVPDHLAAPLHLQDITVLSQPHEAISVRRSIRNGEGSQLLATEEVFSTSAVPEGQRLYASSTDLELGTDSKTVFLTVHAPDLSAVSVYRRTATTGPGARVAWVWNGLGGYRTKMRNGTVLAGNGSVAEDFQTFYGAKEQSYDSSMDITHVGTDTHANSVTRGVFTDQARGMSRGLVRIEANARKTLSVISEHAMLLSRGARSDTIPILEILCRDVKATHSTSVAPVDPEKVFYLESRGMRQGEAIRMIGEGFLSYVLERTPVSGLRELLYPRLAARWDGKSLDWGAEGQYPLLPPLSVTGTEAAPEWRFDAKLR